MSSPFDRVADWAEYEVRRRWHRVLLYVFDRAGCLLLRAVPPPAQDAAQAREPRRILAVRPEHLGDLVLTFPALQRLRRAFPASHLTLLVRPEYRAWISSLAIADEVWARDVPWTRRAGDDSVSADSPPERRRALNRYDLAVTFHGDLRTLLLARRYAPAVAGYREGGGGFLLTISRRRDRSEPVRQSHLDLVAEVELRYPHSLRTAPVRLPHVLRAPASHFPGPYVILHPGAGQPSKLWFLDGWLEVAAACRRRGLHLVLTGSAAERSLCAPIVAAIAPSPFLSVWNLAGQTSLTELFALVAAAQAVVAPDTGIIHLAVALGIPSVALFGPNDPRQWGYQSKRHRSLVHPQPCSFCRLARCPRTDVPRACLRVISAAEVITQLQLVLEGKATREETCEESAVPADQPPALSASRQKMKAAVRQVPPLKAGPTDQPGTTYQD